MSHGAAGPLLVIENYTGRPGFVYRVISKHYSITQSIKQVEILSGVSPEFLALPAKGQLQLQTGRRGFRRTEGCLGENSADPIGERIEPEGRNSKEALRDDQEFLAEDA